jgi:hypothetical protein
MNKHIPLLSAFLVLQLVIAGFLFSANPAMDNVSVQKPLLTINSDAISQIKVIEDDGEISFVQKDNEWQLDGYSELILQKNKLSALTSELANLQVTWPVTSTTSSHERFNLTEDNFEKQIIFSDKDGNEQVLLLGKSPSYKQLYVRDITDNDVYSIKFSAYQVSADVNNWFDKSMLAIDSISKINHSQVNLAKVDEDWQLTPPSALAEQQSLDSGSIEDFINQLTSLSVTGLATESLQATNTLTVLNDQDEKFVYRFAENSDSYFVKRDDIEHWFTLPKAKFEQLANLTLNQFTAQPDNNKEEDSATLSDE